MYETQPQIDVSVVRPRSTSPTSFENRYNSELLLNHFGFNPFDFLDVFIDAVHQSAANVLAELESRLSDLPSHCKEDILFSFETLLVSHLDKIWGTFEEYFKKAVWTIPTGLYVPSSQIRAPPEGVTENTLVELNEQLHETRVRFAKLNFIRSKLNERFPALDTATQRLKEELKELDQIESQLSTMEKLSNVTSEYEEVLDLHQLLLAQKKAQAKMTPKSPPPHWQWVSSEISRGIMKNDYLDFEFTERLGTRLSEVMGEGPSKEQESREK